MASEIPVFPEVASSRIEPGRRRPRASRSSISARATRSLTEPVGFAPSSFTNRRMAGSGESLGTPTRLVWPIAATMSSNAGAVTVEARGGEITTTSASGDRGQKPDLVAVGDGGLEAREVPDVLAVEVDVHEPMEPAVR